MTLFPRSSKCCSRENMRSFQEAHPTPPSSLQVRRVLVIGGAGKMGRWFAEFMASQGFAVEIADPSGAPVGFTHLADWRDSPLKQRLRSDLTTAIKDRDKVRSGTIRMVLAAISEAEVAGAEAIELSEQQVLDVVIREAKKRREAEEAYLAAGRSELAEREQAERSVLAEYLPAQLSAGDISTMVREAIERSGAAGAGIKAMGKVMAIVTPQTRGRADGAVVAAEVKRQLAT